MRHILDEFQRVAMANPDLFFSLHHNVQEMFHLPPGNLRQRVVKIFGDPINKQLVPVQQETDILKISGFVSKPDYYKKNRGEQLFFVNKRFIKSPYLHAAVVAAFEELFPSESFPLYVLFLEIDPGRIDVNVHPTKQEIKFDDEKLVFNYLKAGIKHALGSHNVTPAIDFETEPAFKSSPVEMPFVRPAPVSDKSGGSGSSSGSSRSNSNDAGRHERNLRHWEMLYDGLNTPSDTSTAPFAITTEGEDAPPAPEDGVTSGLSFQAAPAPAEVLEMDDDEGNFSKNQKEPYQIHGQYIISPIKSGFLMIDQQAASERILYERYLAAYGSETIGVQKILFPKQVELSPADAVLLRDILPEINRLGFEIDEFGGNTFIIHGAPADVSSQGGEEQLLEKLLEQYKNNLELETGIYDNLARAMARSAALRRGQNLTVAAMQNLLDQLFACAMPYSSPSGRLCFVKYELDDLHKRFAG
jgi:DNA mismatch repair protein MutL